MAEQDSQQAPKAPPGVNYVRKFPPTKGKEKAKSSGVNRLTTADVSCPKNIISPLAQGGGEKPNIQPVPIVNQLKTIGPDVSAAPKGCASLHLPAMTTTSTVTPTDFRGVTPSDLMTANATAMAEPDRWLLKPDDNWLALETHQQPQFHVVPEINPVMEFADRRCARPTAPVPDEITPVAIHRIVSSMPESTTDLPSGDWMLNALGEASAFLTRTGSKKDAQRALAALAVLREVYPVMNRAGKSPSVIYLGDQMTRIDYSPHPVSVGGLEWLSIDFGENLPLGDKLRKALSEGEKTERNQCVVLHLAAAYEWVRQGCPRRPHSIITRDDSANAAETV